ncbi:MAG: hypothetical protein K0R15_1282 [Clostridiales bacterium]|jgi:hypothetical protein|nr:hypothetical protein [Clostridiales bacterium]
MFNRFTTNELNHFKKENTFDLLTTDYKKISNIEYNEALLKGTMFVSSNAYGKSNMIMPANILR